MDLFVIIGGTLALLTLLTRVANLDERKRIVKGEYEFLRARIVDLENIDRVRRRKKRKRDDDLCVWLAEGRELLMAAETLLMQIEEHRSFLPSVKTRLVIDKVISALAVHDKKGDTFCSRAFPQKQDPLRGDHIPVKELMGQGATDTLEELQHVLQDTKVGRVAVHGGKGIGKTLLMKHLHNSALKWIEKFTCVFWVTSPDHFSIELLQDALAAVVKCEFATGDDLSTRARKLSEKLGNLGNFALFLDAEPGADFSLEQIGVPVPAEGSECKVVVTTSSTSLGCRMLDGFETVELNSLSEIEAFRLFMQEAKLDMGAVALLGNIPELLVKKCHGVPRTIVTLASRICGINDPHEWRNLLFEIEKLEKKIKLPCKIINDDLEV